MDARSFTGSDDRDLRPRQVERDEHCIYCDVLPTEPHHPACRLYEPICACGRVARRFVCGEPTCTTCYRVG